ncbi:hypothetical protein HanRHA438_Chr09g0406301 [Helianthus annuus]|uniref:Membrane-associated kinase regulator n=1 Tax=Helianthus annuus TaxID=4232 RepID=A0A251T981_HELAN|nr:uncharacterized protein LOC110887901 [Helianthus annuus]KAF5791410.1 hypothetical protein HanXRQr2_Chr09g0394461 [Helianthus annuus]KAJ0526477.1 hypothetical protein HanHA300_Chr09g0323681 [Helianthus annuus]KAJ0534921.1 hypothetical protein HanIR_Chr09g0425121 [Helianthus annuus]KAJ0542870.1 hypothetical protein HanHA89_Chr09g0344601 [Helianthus annuus]KAJ0707926.1 hypothetical protein HanLR1_Chr09g0323941 [Helianthus annuus]
MAIDLYSDTTMTTTSPRISFSYDLSQNDTVPVEQLLRSLSSSSVDFNFCVQQNSDLPHASMADELFYNGKILPTQEVRSKTTSLLSHPPPPKHEHSRSPAVTSSLELEDEEVNMKQHNNNNNNTKSFWGFKRSSSCGNGYARSLCPIALLSRSHSTGSSSTSSKRSSCSKEVLFQKPNRSFQKPVPASASQKPPLRKSGYGYGTGSGNGIRVNPVLNLGFGSFFSSNSKNKNKK